jgi:hypothetical protein
MPTLEAEFFHALARSGFRRGGGIPGPRYRRVGEPAQHGEDGSLHGAVTLAMDHVTTAAGLADWVERQRV